MSGKTRLPDQKVLPPYQERAPLWGYFWMLGLITSVVAIVLFASLFLAHWDRIEVFSRYLGGGTFDPFSWRQAPPVAKKPRLQVDDVLDLKEYERRENEILSSYAWTDRSRGRVRVPIDRAMEMYLRNGGTRGGAP